MISINSEEMKERIIIQEPKYLRKEIFEPNKFIGSGLRMSGIDISVSKSITESPVRDSSQDWIYKLVKKFIKTIPKVIKFENGLNPG